MNRRLNQKPVTPEDALLRMADLCARSEQCTSEIETKLYRLRLSRSQIDAIVDRLRKERFIDDTRYAQSYITDKLRFSGWGPMKIRAGLAAKRIAASTISEAMAEIEEEAFRETALEAARAKSRTLDLSQADERVKMMRFLASRGFTAPQCSWAMRELARRQEREE